MFIDKPEAVSATQKVVDRFYRKHGKCCAGCDHWRWYNSMVGECTRSPPISGEERMAMLGMRSLSISPEAGHVVTRRDHVCGEFVDTYEWGG